MVSNRALSQIAEQYKIPGMVIAEQASKYMLQGGEKTKGSLFEAYVAGVYYSYLLPREGELELEPGSQPKEPQQGPSGGPSFSTQEVGGSQPKGSQLAALTTEAVDVKPSLDPITPPGESDSATSPTPSASSNEASNKDSPATTYPPSPTASDSPSPTPTIKPTPSPPSPRTHGQAFDHICQWLWPLFHPIAIFLTIQLRSDPQFSSISSITPTPTSTSTGTTGTGEPGEGGLIVTQGSKGLCVVPEDWKLEDERASGAVGALNQFLGRHYGSGVLPTWLTRSKGQQIWKLTCIVKTPEGKEM